MPDLPTRLLPSRGTGELPAAPVRTQSVADPNLTTGGDPGPSPAALPASVERYTLGDEIARGGMGVVYRATDTVLGREVAVKALQERFAPGSGAARRFLDEARITGQLQHPGIPPVHDLGTLPDGRPFLAMKLIKGDTLDALVASAGERRGVSPPVAEPSASRPDAHPAAVAPGSPNLVAAFEAVCQAVAYAHAHGVIHRDLKPANVMVGAFGEVQVMDWGLAKVLANRGRERPEDDPDRTAPGTEVISSRDLDDVTQAGSVLGTPAFMPPEQAAGAVGKVDARSDVFGLGAILCVILTGQPPFTGSSAETTRVKAATGDVGDCFTRLAACGADPELVALCKRCLAQKREDRPADAGAVAAEVARLRAAADERAKRAELDRAAAAERRKRLRLGAGAVAAVVAVVVGGLAAVVAVGRSKNAELQTERDAARAAEAEARARRDEATDQRRLAQARLEKAVGAVEQVVLRVAGEKWALRPELQTERRQVLEEAVAFFAGLGTEESKDPAVRTQAARANLFAASAYIALGEYDPCRAAASAARGLYRGLQAEFPRDPRFVRGEAEAAALLGHAEAIHARFTDALARYEEVVGLGERAVALNPDDPDNQLTLADGYSSLALFYSFQRPELSRQYHARTLAIGEGLLARGVVGFKVRLTSATSLANLAVSEIYTRPAAADEQLARAAELVRVLDAMTPPTARVAEMFASTKAGVAVYRGVLLVRAKQVYDGCRR